MCLAQRLNSEPGFTLLEVLVTLAILGLLAASSTYVVPNWKARITLVEVISHFDEAVSLASADAIRTGAPRVIFFDPQGFSTKVTSNNYSYAMPASVEYKLESALELNSNGRPVVAFFPDGTTSGGLIVFSDGSQSESRDLNWSGTATGEENGGGIHTD